MSVAFEPPDIRYIAYIDESGDPGLRKIRTATERGATEWLSIGAILIRAEHESDTVNWVRSIRQTISALQGPALHYRLLNSNRKLTVCQELIKLPVRAFVAISNKKNMEQYHNERVERARPSSQEWFYNWCMKLLIERITDFVEYNSMRRFGEPKHVQLVFSERGGLRYTQTGAYHDLVKAQARSKTTWLTKRVVKWRVLHPASNVVIPANQNAGVQLADTIASSFHQAVDSMVPTWDTAFAETLKPIMPEECGACAGYGVALFPHWSIAKLTCEQQKIFRFYGYPVRE
jgi:hypothetical protein